ncbi:MAG TPA: hypothetical protein P5550_01640, partial [Bacteroidales bacterium]|nr:hypothetical protein [Bacteroidales bacterium]
GMHPFIYRLLVLIIVFYGLLSLYRLLRELLGDSFWAGSAVVLLFTSKILVYYGNNFLTDAPALALALAAAWQYYRYALLGRRSGLYLSMAMFLLAGLLKVSALLLFLCIGAVVAWKAVVRPANTRDIRALIPFALVLVLTFMWYSYARIYSRDNAGMFLQGILPAWELDRWALKARLISFYQQILPSFLNLSALYLLVFLLLYNVLNFRKAKPFLLAINILGIAGSLVFLLLFFQVFDVHDYYMTNLLVMIPVTLATTLDIVRRHHPALLELGWLKAIVVVALLLLTFGTASVNRLKYDDRDLLARASFFTDPRSQDFYTWFHWNYSIGLQGLEGADPWLSELGVTRDDLVVSLPDAGINNSLYLMQRRGFTDFGYNDLAEGARMERFIAGGARFLVVNDTSIYSSRPWLQPYLQDKAGSRGHVAVFRLRSSARDTVPSVQ